MEYRRLPHGGEEIGVTHASCDALCPSECAQSKRMAEIAGFFGV